MRKYRNLSVYVKVPIMLGLAGFVVLAVVCLLLSMPFRSISLKDSAEVARLNAEYTKELLMEYISGPANLIRAYSGVIAQLAASEAIPKDKKRELLLMEIKALMESEIKPESIWCILEPDALDGMDEHYINRMGSNSQGVFAPRFVGEAITPIELLNSADLYEIPKETGLETITAPAWYDVDGRMVQMFSISVPIRRDGVFLGVIVTDYFTEDMNHLIENFNSDKNGKLITDKGIVAVHYDAKRIGKKAEYGNQEILLKIAEGKAFEGIYQYEGKTQYKAYVPIQLSKVNKPWFYAVDMSAPEIYESAQKAQMYLITYFLLAVVLISLTGIPVMRPVLKNITQATGILHQLSLGHLNQHVEERQNGDEIGKMKDELRHLIEGMNHVADFAYSVGKGYLETEYRLLSDGDMLGKSLLDMRRNLQTTDQLKSAFLANISNEIRIPLNGITGFLCFLSSDDLSPENRREYIEVINSSSAQLSKLIDDVVDMAKIQSNQMNIRPIPFQINNLMTDLHLIFETYLKTNNKKHIALILDDSGFIDNGVAVVDPTRLRQVLDNLITNAIKYTDKGYIRFGYRQSDNEIEFVVEDTGIGISKDMCALISEYFRRAESEHHLYKSAGLSLNIARYLVQMMGGEIWVDSEEGSGSRFIFTIAYHPCETG